MVSTAQAQVGIAQTTADSFSAIRMGATRACVDLFTLSLAVLGGFWCWSLFNTLVSSYHPIMFLAVGFSFTTFAFYGLYPGIGMTAVEHIRRIVKGTTLVYLLLTVCIFLVKEWWVASRGGFILSWLLSLALVPLGRWIASDLLRSRPWWGVPVMVLGAGETGQIVIRNLLIHQVLGYRPVVCLDDDPRKQGVTCLGIPVPGGFQDAAYFAKAYHTHDAIVAMRGLPSETLVRYLERWSKIFHKIVIVPDLFGVASLWTEPLDLGGVLGLAIRCNLLNPVNRYIKRAIDLVVSLVALVASVPFFAIVALWIKQVSPGSALYVQEREGQDGRTIRVLKIRTMYPDAAQTLDRYLEENPAARQEWARFCKLKCDPRIVPGIGSFLRKTSLDELPQLWNILKGEMSLVGPRPFPTYHNRRFDPEFQALRTQVTPGLTGLWQISARSNGDLSVQTTLDSYYIRNWSLWLDIYILVRTLRSVLAQEGA